MALMMLVVTSRVSRQSPLSLIVPGKEEILVIRRVAARGLSGAMARVRR